MCHRCTAHATGLRSGKGNGAFAKLIGLHTCLHDTDCECRSCEYRHENPYSDGVIARFISN